MASHVSGRRTSRRRGGKAHATPPRSKASTEAVARPQEEGDVARWPGAPRRERYRTMTESARGGIDDAVSATGGHMPDLARLRKTVAATSFWAGGSTSTWEARDAISRERRRVLETAVSEAASRLASEVSARIEPSPPFRSTSTPRGWVLTTEVSSAREWYRSRRQNAEPELGSFASKAGADSCAARWNREFIRDTINRAAELAVKELPEIQDALRSLDVLDAEARRLAEPTIGEMVLGMTVLGARALVQLAIGGEALGGMTRPN